MVYFAVKRRTRVRTRGTRKRVTGGVIKVKKFGACLLGTTVLVTCPCHLILTLALVLGLLSGTALGTALATHTNLVAAAIVVYFFIALIGTCYLLDRILWEGKSSRASACSLGRRGKVSAARNKAGFRSHGSKVRK